jgi:site-specific DNA-methyltransferase (adenine-specific)
MNVFYHGDCLFVMQHDIAPESVDLIYLDPPFFTGKIQKGTKKWQPGAMEVSFEDSKKFWAEKGLVSKTPEWMKYIATKDKERAAFASYLYYMMVRLQACHRVLKPTGSIYLHCDWRASHYLKMAMDEIFKEDNFQNEIVWYYQTGGASKNRYSRKHDTIFWYSKTNKYTFNGNAIKIPRTQKAMERARNPKGARIAISDAYKNPDDVFIIQQMNPMAKERTGYPTQKPDLLLECIIRASSNEGDLVLDPFCGCGTTVIAASKLNRQWIGIDIDTSPREKGQLPTAFQVIQNRSHELFSQSVYITRTLEEVLDLSPLAFEAWVNEFYKATKPHPDKGVDGVTKDGIPIQAKSFQIGYNVISQFITDAKYHPSISNKPIKKVIVASQVGFDDKARQRKFEVETTEGIEVLLVSPKDMLEMSSSELIR